MKLNKTIAMVALVAGGLLAGGALQAQDAKTNKPPGMAGGPGGPGGMRQQVTPEKMAKDLGLSEEVTAKFKAVLEDSRKKMAALRTDDSVAQADKRAKGKEIRDAATAEIKKILTPEQYEKYLKMAPGPRNRPGAGAPPAAGDKPMEKPMEKPAEKK